MTTRKVDDERADAMLDNAQHRLAACYQRIGSDKAALFKIMDMLDLLADRAADAREMVRLRELITSAIRWVQNPNDLPLPRWSVVGSTFGLGSTSATRLCREFGIDPNDELIPIPRDDDGGE